MVKLKDLIKIMPNPTEFYLCILDEHDNANARFEDETFSLCCTSDFKSFWFRWSEDDYSQDRILELLEYEVTCIRNYIHDCRFSNGAIRRWTDFQESMEHFFIYIDKPLQKGKKNG